MNQPFFPTDETASASENESGAATLPNDVVWEWDMDQVVSWLAQNKFSLEWQETFKALDFHGSEFFELGVERIFGEIDLNKQIYHRLAKECADSGTGWDEVRENLEMERVRSLIGIIARKAMESAPKYRLRENIGMARPHGVGKTGFFGKNELVTVINSGSLGK